MLLSQKISSFSFSHILSFEEEFIITLFKLAVVQEKQLFIEGLFSLDSIYLPYSEGKKLYLACTNFHAFKSRECDTYSSLTPYLHYYASNISDKPWKSS